MDSFKQRPPSFAPCSRAQNAERAPLHGNSRVQPILPSFCCLDMCANRILPEGELWGLQTMMETSVLIPESVRESHFRFIFHHPKSSRKTKAGDGQKHLPLQFPSQSENDALSNDQQLPLHWWKSWQEVWFRFYPLIVWFSAMTSSKPPGFSSWAWTCKQTRSIHSDQHYERKWRWHGCNFSCG